MYNEVYKSCPNCDTINEIQIHQIVGGFGEFSLDTLKNIKDLTLEQKHEFAIAVNEKTFYCINCEHAHSVTVIVEESDLDPNNTKVHI